VRPGDTLSSIAARELGSAGRWPEIYRANRSQLDDPDELAPETLLALPTGAATDASPDPDGSRSHGQAPPGEHPASGRATDGDGSAPTAPGQGAPGSQGRSDDEAEPSDRSAPSAGSSAAGPPRSSAPTGEGAAGGAAAGPGAPTAPSAPPTSSAPAAPPAADAGAQEAQDVPVLPLLGVGGLLAAGLVSGLRGRRRL